MVRQGITILLKDLLPTIAEAKGARLIIGCDGIIIEIVHGSTASNTDACGNVSTNLIWRSTQIKVDNDKINEIIRYLYQNTCVVINFVTDIDNPNATADLDSLANGAAQSIDPFVQQMKEAIFNTVLQGFSP